MLRMSVGDQVTLYLASGRRTYRARIGCRAYYSVRKGQRLAGLEYFTARDFADGG
jgi:hypothetical protein